MVKKEAGRKDDKKLAKDLFDPVLIESSQAGTVVLMLDSVEEEVVIKATEALYRFSEKCDANKLLLLQLDTITRVLKLLASESHVIHRNSCLVLGSMSKHAAVARTLKQLDIIPTLLKLLGPEEDTVINEYAALTLLSLANYYSCKRAICENNGLEPLIRCLGSHDADVQKNSIETLSLLLQDFEAKKSIRELNGIMPVLELLKSEYAVIQSEALVALRLIAEDASNRQGMRDAGAVVELVNIVTSQNLSDLHILSVLVLANLFEDHDTMLLMKDDGTLKKLMTLANDLPPVVEERKVKGKEREKAAAKGKKGKANAADDESKRLQAAAIFVPLSAETKEQVAWAFHRAAKNGENRKLLTEQELEKLLIFLLNHSNSQVQIAASQAVRVMAENFVSRDAFGKLGGIGPLLKMVLHDSTDVQAAAVNTLSVLTTTNELNCREVFNNDGLQPLISSLSAEQEMIVDHALQVLVNMAADDHLRSEIICGEVIPALVQLLSSESEDIQRKASSALIVFISDASQRNEFVSCSGVPTLVGLLSSSNKEVQKCATSLIASLAADQSASAVLCQSGALDILRYMQTSNESNRHVDVAIKKLLDFNLSAKYALTGRLHASDTITDGFYDVGHLKLGKPFMPLEWYRNEPVNSKRPVLYVNAGHQSLEVRAEQASQKVCAGDERLIEMIDEISEILEPLKFCSSAERVIALAQYVARQMGGPIDKGNFSGFSWELHISKLKYESQSNVIPIGRVTTGIHYHRALLFKVLGDRIGIPSSLIRGEFNRAWNELELSAESEFSAVRYPPKTYIIDLIYQPGRLMKIDSADAVTYQQL